MVFDNRLQSEYAVHMTENRIKEVRLSRHLTEEQLAELAETTQVQISRLENGRRRLTVEWLMRLSKALECAPEDLLGAITLASFNEEATPYNLTDEEAAKALEIQQQVLYLPNSNALENIDRSAGAAILFNQSQQAIQSVETGDIVLVELISKEDPDDRAIVVRQFIAPDLFSTNKRGRNTSFHRDEEKFEAVIVGIHKPATGPQ